MFQLSSSNAFPLLRYATAFLHGRCDLGLPSPINADCRVMVTSYYNPALSAFVDTHRERHFLFVTAPAAYLARVSWRDSFKPPASLFSFAFRYCEKSPPSYIADCLREMVIPDHPAYVQIFHRDRVKASDQIGRYLVVEILPTPRHFQMRTGYFDSLLRTPFRSFLFARKPTLLSLQIIQRVLVMTWVVDLFAVRECGEGRNAGIYPDSLSGWRQGFRLRDFTDQKRIPTVNAARDPKLFALSFNWTGEPDTAASNSGNCELVAFDWARSDFLVFLREGVIAVFALESGKAGLPSALKALKEALESFVNTLKRVLLNCPQMTFHFGQCASVRQMARLLGIVEGGARDPVTGNPLGKGGVVNLARVFKLTLTRLNKAFVCAKLKFVGFDYGIFGLSHCLTFSINVVHWRDLVRGCNLSPGRFSYTAIGQSVKRRNSEGNCAANARNNIGLAHLHSASLHCRGRRLVLRHSVAASLGGNIL